MILEILGLAAIAGSFFYAKSASVPDSLAILHEELAILIRDGDVLEIQERYPRRSGEIRAVITLVDVDGSAATVLAIGAYRSEWPQHGWRVHLFECNENGRTHTQAPHFCGPDFKTAIAKRLGMANCDL